MIFKATLLKEDQNNKRVGFNDYQNRSIQDLEPQAALSLLSYFVLIIQRAVLGSYGRPGLTLRKG